jgi:hypothetical protein
MIRFKCPKCFRVLEVDDPNQIVAACPDCGQKCRVPAPSTSRPPRSAPDAISTKPEPAPPRHSRQDPEPDQEDLEPRPEWSPRKKRSRYRDEDDYHLPRRRRPRADRDAEGGGLDWLFSPFTIILAVLGLCALLLAPLALFVKGAGLALAVIATVVMFIGLVWIWGVALQDGELLFCILIPFYVLFYTLRNLDRAGKPLAIYLIGFFFIFVGAVLDGLPERPLSWAATPPPNLANQGNPVNPQPRPVNPVNPQPRPNPFNPQPQPNPFNPQPFAPKEGRPAWVKHDPAAPTDFKGLLAWWNFDEGKGNRAADASGNGQDAVVHGGKWVAGIKGKALWLDGVADYVDYGSSPKLNFPARGPFTFAGWIQSSAGNGTILSQRDSRDGSPDIDVTLDGGRVKVEVRHDGNEFSQPASVTSNPVNDGDWHHFALTRNGNGVVELFVDGAACGQGASDGAVGSITTDLRCIGLERFWATVRGGGRNAYFSGCVDDFCIYNRALTAQEIGSLSGR